NDDDQVRLVMFSFWEARQALSYSEHLTLSDDTPFLPIVDTKKLNILEVACSAAVVKIGFAANISFDRFKPGPSLRPSVVIEFEESQSLSAALHFASDVLGFFELSCGRHSRLLDVTVSP